MSEVYEGEETVTFVLLDSVTITSVTGYQVLYDDSAQPVEISTALSYTETPIGGTPTHKEVEVNVYDLSSWPTDFFVHVVYDDAGTQKTIKQKFLVVRPYATVQEIAAAGGFDLDDDSKPNYRSYATIREHEAVARKVIEAYTGRTFKREYTAVKLDGTDQTELYCPYEVQWVGLVTHNKTEEAIYSSTTGSVVVSPSGHLLTILDDQNYKYGFPEGYNYTVVGIFGEDVVPYDIQLAAKQLAVHYLCQDAGAANAYVDQTKWGESQTRTNRLGFVGTGLRTVDIILDPYRFHDIRVL